MSCATATIKYLVFIFNALCALAGIGVVVVNALALETVTDNGRLVCIFFMVLASTLLVTSVFGCCGAIRENSCFTWTYAAFLVILVIANAAIVFGYISHIDGATHAQQEMDTAWALQLNGTDVMSIYQTKLHCCGRSGAQDYANASLTIPTSCYENGDNSKPESIYAVGCLQILMMLYESAEHLVVIFSWITLAVESGALVFACILAITFRNQQRRSRY